MQITKQKNLVHHIDAPIRKAVAGMALLGFKPIMSCCGFDYKGQEKGRTHFINKPYIYLDGEAMSGAEMAVLVRIVMLTQWSISGLPHGIIDFYARGWEPNHPWKDPACPHNHEMGAIAIATLVEVIDNFLACNDHLRNSKREVTDGNQRYLDRGITQWQYEPAEPWKVDYSVYEKLS